MIPKKVLRRRAVEAKTGKSRSAIYLDIADPASDFPRPIKLGPHAVGWFEDEIDAWLERRRAERDAALERLKAAEHGAQRKRRKAEPDDDEMPYGRALREILEGGVE